MNMKPMSFDFKSRRSMVTARRGMVAASNPLAAQAGLNILRQGGNAADAAVAAGAMMNVTEPASTGIGGDMFALYYDATTRQITALNGSGRAPAAASLDGVRARGHITMPARDALAVTVPGASRGWYDLLERHGTMTLADVLADAIYYAGEGFPAGPAYSAMWRSPGTVDLLKSRPNTDDYLPNGSGPQPGQIMRLPGLAKTLRAVAEGGPDAFYTGPIAEAIVAALQENGSSMTLDDLKNHTSSWGDPICTDYRGVTVMEHPPNGQGLAALQALNIAEGWELCQMDWESPERMHRMVEAMRLAFADAGHWIADPATNPAPLDFLLSKGYAAQRRALVSDDRAMEPPSYGMPPDSSNTIYLCAVDGAGNACSFINSLYMGWGSGIVPKGVGIFLQNRGAGFSLEPDHPNALAGGKRPYHTIIPGMVTKDGDLWAAFGVMGGFMQPQGHFQVISAMIDDDLNPQEALNRPRWCLGGGAAVSGDSTLMLEEGIPTGTMARLAELGHQVRPIAGRGRSVFGRGQIIRRDADTGVLFGGSEPRADGLVAAF